MAAFALPARGASFQVGTFSKSTATAPVIQKIPHSLKEPPKALILWTTGQTSEAFGQDFMFVIGLSAGTRSLCVGGSSQNGVPGTNSWRRLSNKAISLVKAAWGGAIIAEADLVSWDANTFSLNWTTNDTSTVLIHYLAIGGNEVSASLLNWQLPTVVGTQSVTGTGFRPELVLSVYSGTSSSAIPYTAWNSHINLSALDGALDQWTLGARSTHDTDAGVTYRAQLPGAAIAEAIDTYYVQGTATSIDPDGFTLDFTDSNGLSGQVFSLALAGLQVKVGSFQKTTATAPALQQVTGVGFQPQAVLLASVQDVHLFQPDVNGRLGLGAAAGSGEAASALQDAYGVSPTQVQAIDKASKVFIKVDNATPSIDAEANLNSLDPDGFTLSWTTNDGVSTEILYLALAEKPGAVTDAGTPDGGGPDAGAPDAGAPDAGGSGGGGADAGAPDGGGADAGEPGGVHLGGCGCSSGGSATVWGAIFVALVLGLSRRRGGRPS